MQSAHGRLQVEIDASVPEVVVLSLSGDVDVTSEDELEAALAQVVSMRPSHAVIDATESGFVSARGLAAIGRCETSVEQVTFCSRTVFAKRLLDLLGYDAVRYVVVRDAATDERGPSPSSPDRPPRSERPRTRPT
ncbi:MAG: hypothetical protein JWM85_649 [Acidimicrobiaceae bacterium]|nr:hypothetical protein [Acidimicrobiaceae bacterium]